MAGYAQTSWRDSLFGLSRDLFRVLWARICWFTRIFCSGARATTPGGVCRKRDTTICFEAIKHFFEQNQSSTDEAQKFYARYQSSGWKTGDKKTIVSWQALARKWIENNQNNRTDEREFNKVGTGKLSVTVNKNYNEPL